MAVSCCEATLQPPSADAISYAQVKDVQSELENNSAVFKLHYNEILGKRQPLSSYCAAAVRLMHESQQETAHPPAAKLSMLTPHHAC